MEEALLCLAVIEIVFICVYTFVSIFFTMERALVHRTINATILTLSYGIETVLRIITKNPTFILSILLLMLWGWHLFNSARTLILLNKIKKQIEEIEKRLKKEQP